MKRIFRTRDYRPDAHRDVDEELQSHLELKVEDLMAQGMGEEEARAAARQALGDPGRNRTRAAAHTRTRLRRRTLLDHLDTVIRDVRYASRRMTRSPGFTAIAILSLAIGVGSNTAVFSVVNGLFLRPPPYRAPHEVCQIWKGMEGRAPTQSTSWREFQALLEVEDVFSGIGAYDGHMAPVRGDQGTRSAYVEAVTVDLFPLLGVDPALGRSFLPDEGRTPGGDFVAILGHGFWMRHFDGDPSVLGRTVHLSGRPFTVVGVTPPELLSLQYTTLAAELFIPMSMAGVVEGRADANGNPVEYPQSVIPLARLAPGVSRDVAEARIEGIVAAVLEARGRENPQGWGLRLLPVMHHAMDPGTDAVLARIAVFFLIVAGLVLLLACTNLANLFLARGVDRKREIAVRLAIGAGRRRIVTQLCTETLLLSALGGAGGFILSQWAVDLLLRLQPQTGFAFTLDTTPDVRVLLFTVAVVSLAGLLFGLVPALAATRTGISPTLKGEGPAGGGRSRLGLGGGLVALQMTVSIILLTGAGLFFHSLLVARNTDPGFSTEDAVSVWINLEISGSPPAEWSQVTEALQERARTMPGIQLLGTTGILPLLNSEVDHVQIPGLDPPEGRDSHGVDIYRIDEGYLEVLEIPLLSGRGIEVGDRADSEPVVLVSLEAARRFWPGESPLGKEIVSRSTDVSYRVVGVVDDVTSVHLSENPQPAIYYSLAQRPGDDVYLVARGTGSQGDVIGALRRAVREVDPDLLILLGQTMKERLGVNLYPARIAALFLGAFGMLALLLAAIGLYGVVSLSVSRRTREVGIRMAVGADAGSVVGMVLKGSLMSVALGGIVGLGLALAGARLIRSFLFGVEPADPATLVGVPLLLGTVATVAALIPAMRASRVDPVEALRSE